MRDTKQLYPELQDKAAALLALCAQNNIFIGIGECLRTVEEQNTLYAKGRTTSGAKVTNCKGDSFSSMHQWGVAFDFYLKMDIDGDGKTNDDAYNDTTKMFKKVGELGKSLGLEWGGSWKSPVDKPHFQLPYWGSTAKKLKEQYGTPDKFFATWDKKPVASNKVTNKVTASKNNTDAARSKDTKYCKTYTTTAGLRLRSGAGISKNIITVIPKGDKVTCYGYYTKVGSEIWLYVQYGKYTGFVSKKYLK